MPVTYFPSLKTVRFTPKRNDGYPQRKSIFPMLARTTQNIHLMVLSVSVAYFSSFRPTRRRTTFVRCGSLTRFLQSRLQRSNRRFYNAFGAYSIFPKFQGSTRACSVISKCQNRNFFVNQVARNSSNHLSSDGWGVSDAFCKF